MVDHRVSELAVELTDSQMTTRWASQSGLDEVLARCVLRHYDLDLADILQTYRYTLWAIKRGSQMMTMMTPWASLSDLDEVWVHYEHRRYDLDLSATANTYTMDYKKCATFTHRGPLKRFTNDDSLGIDIRSR